MGPLILKIIEPDFTEIRNVVISVSSSTLTFHSECHSVYKSASVSFCLTWKCEATQLSENELKNVENFIGNSRSLMLASRDFWHYKKIIYFI